MCYGVPNVTLLGFSFLGLSTVLEVLVNLAEGKSRHIILVVLSISSLLQKQVFHGVPKIYDTVGPSAHIRTRSSEIRSGMPTDVQMNGAVSISIATIYLQKQ